MTVTSLNTELNKRILWYDGDSTVDEDSLMQLVSKGSSLTGLYVKQISDNVRQYNALSSTKISTKDNVRPLNLDWNIPDEYKNIDIRQYIIDKLSKEISCQSNWGIHEQKSRAKRVSEELKLYEQLNLIDVLRTLIYIINTLQSNNIVWGVGRGSSVSSYVLYLIGVHDVDSVEYDLNVHEFLRSNNQ